MNCETMEHILGKRELQEPSDIRQKIFMILKIYNAPRELYDFYEYVTPREEVVYNDFTFHSMENIVKYYDIVFSGQSVDEIKQNLKHAYDIGFTYIGMGHVCALVYDPRCNKYYFRHDGGSNDWDRTTDVEFFEYTFKPNDKKYAEYLLSFVEAVKHLKEKNFDSLMITYDM